MILFFSFKSVKLWDLETGKCQFEFTNAHGDEAITCMSYDGTGRRLITGSRGGECKIWNFNNGHCIKTLRKEDVYDEITDITYVQVYNNKFIVTVGWDRSINIYDDKPYDMKEESQPLPRWPEDIVRPKNFKFNFLYIKGDRMVAIE